jgi:hypothetical protein
MSRTKDRYAEIAQRQRWTETEGRIAVDAWRRSGQSLEVFSVESGISTWRLKAWSKRLDAAKAPTNAKRASAGRKRQALRFVPAVITSSRGVGAGVPTIVIRLPDGIEVELRGDGVELDKIGRVVAQLRRAGA